jgi:2-polyprenyl-3-methyl-5-hydroxy-6-metoxy-1,4-benzoquinol methylase
MKSQIQRFKTALGIAAAESAQPCTAGQQLHEQIQAICSKNAVSAIAAIGLAGELGVKQIYQYILAAITGFTPLAPREYVFFTLHTQMDHEHGQGMQAIAADLADTPINQEQLRASMAAALTARSLFWDALLERALKMPQQQNNRISPTRLYEANSQKWVRQAPSCLSDFTARPSIFSLCETVKDAVILDLGCGEGCCARELMKRGARKVIGVDISTNLVAAAQAEEEREPLGITYLNGNATNVLEVLQNQVLLAVQAQQFDIIVAVFLFNYLTFHEMLQCMTQIQQLLKPSGKFIFAVPHPSFAFFSKPESTFHFDESVDVWEQLRRSSALKAQQYRLKNNSFPVFSRDLYTNEFSCRYMRYWIESGHEKAQISSPPLLTIALNALDRVIENDPTIYRVARQLRPGEIIYTNNHICLHNRTAYEEKVNEPKRHMIRAWIDFNPTI